MIRKSSREFSRITQGQLSANEQLKQYLARSITSVANIVRKQHEFGGIVVKKKYLILALAMALTFSFCLTSVSHAASTSKPLATHTSASANPLVAYCGNTYYQTTYVYDSYSHWQGTLYLGHNDCGNSTWGEFWSNNNTWKQIYIYVEYTYIPGYHEAGPYYWVAYNGYYSPSYYGSGCYYAEIDLVDNRGIDNWYGTNNYCF